METPSNRIRFTFELPGEMLEALTERAARQERSIGGQIRHDLSGILGLKDEDEDEPARDKTPNLPGI